jgi:hypothetical protein
MSKVKIIFEMDATTRDELVAAICWAQNYNPTITVQKEQSVTIRQVDGSTMEQIVLVNEDAPNPIGPGQFAMNEFLKYGQQFIEKKRQNDAWKESVIATKAKFDAEIVNNPNITVSAEEV